MGTHTTYRLFVIAHFGVTPTLSIMNSSVSVGFSLPAVIFTRNLDFFVGSILTISTSVQRINSRPDIWMYMPRTTDQKHLVTTSTTRSYERGYRGRNNESEADLPSLAIMVFLVREKPGSVTLTGVRKSRSNDTLNDSIIAKPK